MPLANISYRLGRTLYFDSASMTCKCDAERRRQEDKIANSACNTGAPQLQEFIDSVEAEFAGWANRNEALRRLCAIT
jgi:hypothetical protein